MDIKSVVHIEIEKNDRVYVFSMPFGSPYGEAYDTCFEMSSQIMQMAKDAQSRLEEARKNERDELSKIEDEKEESN